MNDAINHLKMAAEDYRRLTTPNQFTITEATARENERLANQFDLAVEALRQMHNLAFEEGIVSGVKSLVDSCNSRRLRKASPASAPEGYVLVPVEPTEEMLQAGRMQYEKWGSVHAGYKAMLAAAPTPPSTEWIDVSKQLPTNGDEVLCALTDGCVRVLEFNTHPEKRFIDRDTGKWWWIKVGHWMPLPKAPAMQEDKP